MSTSLQPHVVVLADERAHVALQADDVDVGDAAAHLEQDVAGELAVLLDDGDEQVGDLVRRVVAQSLPQRPKSVKATRPSGIAKRFPGCGSAW